MSPSPYRPSHLTKYKDASALGSGDHTDSIGKLYDYSVPIFERHGKKTFGVNCLRLDLAGKPPRYLVQMFTTEDTGRWEAAAVSISVHLCQALHSEPTQYFGLLSYHWAPREQCLQVEIVNLKCLKRLLKYQPIARDHLIWKAYDLIEENVLTCGFDRLELEGLHAEVGLFGPVSVAMWRGANTKTAH